VEKSNVIQFPSRLVHDRPLRPLIDLDEHFRIVEKLIQQIDDLKEELYDRSF
jgi:hypothetical protein